MTNIKEGINLYVESISATAEQIGRTYRDILAREKIIFSLTTPLWVPSNPAVNARIARLQADVVQNKAKGDQLVSAMDGAADREKELIMMLEGKGKRDDEERSGWDERESWDEEGEPAEQVLISDRENELIQKRGLVWRSEEQYRRNLEEASGRDDKWRKPEKRVLEAALTLKWKPGGEFPQPLLESLRQYWKSKVRERRASDFGRGMYYSRLRPLENHGVLDYETNLYVDRDKKVAALGHLPIPFESPAEFAAFESITASTGEVKEFPIEKTRGRTEHYIVHSNDDGVVIEAWEAAGGPKTVDDGGEKRKIQIEDIAGILQQRLLAAGVNTPSFEIRENVSGRSHPPERYPTSVVFLVKGLYPRLQRSLQTNDLSDSELESLGKSLRLLLGE